MGGCVKLKLYYDGGFTNEKFDVRWLYVLKLYEVISHKYAYLEGGCDKILMLINGVIYMRHVCIQWVGGKVCIANLFRYILGR